MSASARYLPREHPGVANDVSARPVKISANPFDRECEKIALPCASFRSSVAATLRSFFFQLLMTQLRQTVKTFRRRSTQNDLDRPKRGASTALRTTGAIASCENARSFRRVKFVQATPFAKNKRRRDDANKWRPTDLASPERVFSSRGSAIPNKKRRRKQTSAQSVGRKRDDSFPRVFSPYTFVSTFPVITFTTFSSISGKFSSYSVCSPCAKNTRAQKRCGLFKF